MKKRRFILISLAFAISIFLLIVLEFYYFPAVFQNIWEQTSPIFSIIVLYSGFFGFTVKGVWDRYKLREEGRNLANRVKKRLVAFLSSAISSLDKVDISKVTHVQAEDKIVRELLIQATNHKGSTDFINTLILCYFCKKYDSKSDADKEDKDEIRKYAELLKIERGSDNTELLFEYYMKVYPKKEFSNISDFEKTFLESYLMERHFKIFYEEFTKKSTIVTTLKKLIKEGEFSSWNITEKTMLQIEGELKMKTKYSKSFLVLGQKIPDSIKEYLVNLPGLTGWRPSFRNTKFIDGGLFSGYIVKPETFLDIEEFTDELKSKYGGNEESVLWVAPINFLEGTEYTFPADRHFSNTNLSTAYEQINWIKGYGDKEDSVVWSVIEKAKVTYKELLTVMPFNIFCSDITHSETDFLTKHYKEVKTSLSVDYVTDFKNIRPQLLAETLFKIGAPEYNVSERKSLGFSEPVKEDELLNRFKNLSTEIVSNSHRLWEATES